MDGKIYRTNREVEVEAGKIKLWRRREIKIDEGK